MCLCNGHLCYLRAVISLIGGLCRIIHTYSPELHQEVKFGDKSKCGRGGMTAKIQAAWDAAQHGCTTVIASGKITNSILHVRRLHASDRPLSSHAPRSLKEIF